MEEHYNEDIVSPDIMIIDRLFEKYLQESVMTDVTFSLNTIHAAYLTDDVNRIHYEKRRLPYLFLQIDRLGEICPDFNPLLGFTTSYIDEDPDTTEIDVFSTLTTGSYPLRKKDQRFIGKSRPTMPLFAEVADFTPEDDVSKALENIENRKVMLSDRTLKSAYMLSEFSMSFPTEMFDTKYSVDLIGRTTTFDGSVPCSLLEVHAERADDLAIAKMQITQADESLHPRGAMAA